MRTTAIVYADYQATTPVDPRVLERMRPFWNECFGNPHSTDHAAGWRAARAVSEATNSVASLIGADADEIVFTSGATESNNLAIFGLARRAPAERSRLLVSSIEHKCVLAPARALAEQAGFIVEQIPVQPNGIVDPNSLEELLDDDVLMVSIMAVNNEVGTIQNLPRIHQALESHGIPLHCDAAQAPCAVNTEDLAKHADLISLSGHKMYGPQGIGALRIHRSVQHRIEPLIHGGGQQDGLRSGTLPLPLCVGMGAAAAILSQNEAATERARVSRQRDRFISLLREGGAEVVVNGPETAQRHPGNANLRFSGHDAQDLLAALQPHLAASTGSACTSGISESSHVLRAVGLSETESGASIRFSFGRFTTDSDIDAASRLVLEALGVHHSR